MTQGTSIVGAVYCASFVTLDLIVEMLAVLVQASAYSPGACPGRVYPVTGRAAVVTMDETLLGKALAGELEKEGAENLFLSEVGWATYLDQACGSSYAMNERPSLASDGYFTASILSNPIAGENLRMGCRGLSEFAGRVVCHSWE